MLVAVNALLTGGGYD